MPSRNGKAKTMEGGPTPMGGVQAPPGAEISSGGGVLGLEEMMQLGQSKGENMVREMLTYSQQLAESLPRTRLTMREIARILRIQGRWNIAYLRTANMPGLLWMYGAMKVSENGAGRKEAVQMIVGDKMNRLRFLDRFHGGGNPGMGSTSQ